MHYRQIYEEHHQCSLLPGIEIHHIDKNTSNNDPSNLMAVTIEEHLAIHLSQEDWGAVQAILMRMENKNAEIADAASKKQKQLVERGVHNFQTMSKERRREISQKAGRLTKEKGIGLHRINQDPILSKLNASKAGKASQEKRRNQEYEYLNALQGKAVEGTRWWLNTNNGQRLRSKEKPDGDGWIEGMTSTPWKRPVRPLTAKTWWTNTQTGQNKRSYHCPSGDNWKRGFTKK